MAYETVPTNDVSCLKIQQMESVVEPVMPSGL